MKTLLLFTTLFFSTFVLEDATAYWGGTLVYMEVLPFWVAYLAVGGGIFVGDMLLYTLGRYGENVKFLGLILAKIHKGIEGHTLYHWLSNFVNKNFIFSIVESINPTNK